MEQTSNIDDTVALDIKDILWLKEKTTNHDIIAFAKRDENYPVFHFTLYYPCIIRSIDHSYFTGTESRNTIYGMESFAVDFCLYELLPKYVSPRYITIEASNFEYMQTVNASLAKEYFDLVGKFIEQEKEANK